MKKAKKHSCNDCEYKDKNICGEITPVNYNGGVIYRQYLDWKCRKRYNRGAAGMAAYKPYF